MKETEKNTLKEDFEFSIFIKEYSFNMDLLSYRLQKFEKTSQDNRFEYLTIFDSIIVQLRAIMLENRQSNYTIQTYYRYHGQEAIALAIDKYLDEPFDAADSQAKEEGNESYRSLRKALKLLSDKFICHYDKITLLDKGSADYISSMLSNPKGKRYLRNILFDILKICKQESVEIKHS